MNRPERKDYIKNVILENNEYIKEFDIVKYCNACDEYIYQLEKALDKICKYLDSVHSCPLDSCDFELKDGCDKVCLERTDDSSLCWKEWSMKDA